MQCDFQYVHRDIAQFEKNQKRISPAGGGAFLYRCVWVQTISAQTQILLTVLSLTRSSFTQICPKLSWLFETLVWWTVPGFTVVVWPSQWLQLTKNSGTRSTSRPSVSVWRKTLLPGNKERCGDAVRWWNNYKPMKLSRWPQPWLIWVL